MGDVFGSNANYKINLDENSECYSPGDVISGTFEIDTTGILEFKAINITYCGDAFVHWEEWKTRKDLDYTHFGHEEYFNVTECVRGGSDVTRLPPGIHSVLFQYLIPDTVPSSFYSEYGCVSYFIKVCVEYGDLRPVDKVEKEFRVIAPLDLNTKDYVKHPMFLELEEIYGFCIPTALNVQVCLPKTGYCPGENIAMNVNVDNDTKVTVKKIIFQIIRKEYYRCHGSASSFSPPEQVLTTLKSIGIPSHSRSDFATNQIVPDMVALIAPNLMNCRIIDVGFYLRVTVKVSGFNDDLTNEAELCIGSIPVTDTPAPYPNSYLDTPPLYPNLDELYPELPPSYSSLENRPNNPGFEQTRFSDLTSPGYPKYPNTSSNVPVIENARQTAPSAPPWDN